MSKQSNLFSRKSAAFTSFVGMMLLFVASPAVASVTLNFNKLRHGDIANDSSPNNRVLTALTAKDGDGNVVNTVTVKGDNINSGDLPGTQNDPGDFIVAFDTTLTGTRDPDLENPFIVGNRAGKNHKRALIIQETDWYGKTVGSDNNNDGRLDFNNNGSLGAPDDEGDRPAGSIIFEFDSPISSVGFDLLDVEAVGEFVVPNSPDNSGAIPGTVTTAGYVGFYENGAEVARVGFNEFVDSDGFFKDSSVEFGNKSANRIREITIDDLEQFANINVSKGFNEIEINLGGSGAVDNLKFTPFTPPPNNIPEASSLLVWAMLGLTVGSYKRRALFAS